MKRTMRYLFLCLISISFGNGIAMEIGPEDVDHRLQEVRHSLSILESPQGLNELPPDVFQDLYFYPDRDDVGKLMRLALLIRPHFGVEKVVYVPEGVEVTRTDEGAFFPIEADTIYKLSIAWCAVRYIQIRKNDGTVVQININFPANSVVDLNERRLGNIRQNPFSSMMVKALIELIE